MALQKLSRRELVGRGLALFGATGLGALASACSGSSESASPPEPAGEVEPFEGTLRILGLGVDLQDQVKRAGEAELGFTLEFEQTSSPVMVERARTRPGTFDLLSGYAYQVDEIWPAGTVVSLDRSRIERWVDVTSLYKLGKVAPGDPSCSVGDGDAPFRKLYTSGVHEPGGSIVVWGQEDGSGPDGSGEPAGLVGAPSTFNLDSVGYNGAELDRPPEDVSWAELFNETWLGRTALFNDPSFGLQSAALAAEALGLMSFRDKGNMTVEEIDALVKILADLKRKGQFRLWSTFDESVDLIAAGDVVVQYMWYPAVAFLQALGQPIRYAAPQEGHLAWAGLLMLSGNVLEDPSKLQACYDYVNWWHSGAPGAMLLPYGYYNAVMDASRALVSADEWGYWVDGEAARTALDSPFGEGVIREGQRRDGGSLRARACSVGTWLSFFDEQSAHQFARWGELVSGR